MKPLALALLGLLLCSACSRLGDNPAGNSAGSSGGSPVTTLDGEARWRAENFWAGKFVKCGDSYYGFVEALLGRKSFYHLKGAVTVVAPLPVTKADKLNGIEYLGLTSFNPQVYRIHDPENGWGAWHDADPKQDTHDLLRDVPLSAIVGKKKGQWDLLPIKENQPEIRKPACSDIP